MSGIRVRAALLSDDPALARLDRATWSTLHAVAPPPQEHQDFFGERSGPDAYLVAEVDGRTAGYLRLVPPTPLASNAHVRQIQGLAVDTWARGRGVGLELVMAALEAARGQGARRVTLRVLGHNTPARRLYEAAGFTVEGVLPGEFLLDGVYVDDVLMGRAL
ncbi:GNAT family N-acetyltransferase [Streptomyces sp. NPDC088354]|uniref:GNAT family N-acetyltransferase n=1 Tax=unclassified Streptomyces TaxID=2593676 RepID=UPI0029AE42BB|nr:GNAT family N-acetyltransferase [Streptomyces sp. MI02-7b]MDX3075277.1 GNAT family N-acetyltransferase [Streptomyces sp. MI02-7b]